MDAYILKNILDDFQKAAKKKNDRDAQYSPLSHKDRVLEVTEMLGRLGLCIIAEDFDEAEDILAEIGGAAALCILELKETFNQAWREDVFSKMPDESEMTPC